MSNEFTTPTILAFEAKLLCSDGLMQSGNWLDIDWKNLEETNKWKAIKIEEKAVRGTKSHWQAEADEGHKDHAKFLQDIAQANPQIVDNAALPFDADTLKLSFSLRVLGNLSKPTACNNPDYETKISSLVENYIKEHRFKELAKRYAINIANGRFLWRNRVCADDVKVVVTIDDKTKLEFNAYEISMKNFAYDNENISKLADKIEKGLSNADGQLFSFIKVEAFTRLGNNQQVYPSQEMNLEKGEKGKVLYKLNQGTDNEIAAMHSQKIGNAIRTIDTWHHKSTSVGAIAIEPYGSVTIRGEAYRPLNKGSFYKVMEKWTNDNDTTIDEQHYAIATLIRGGVFSGESKKKK